MKLLTVFLAAGLSILAADLSGVKSVYLMPMSGSLDQYLATRLTNSGAIQVVTDPQKADAIFTDRIGSGFEQSLQDMYAPKKKKEDDGKLSSEDFAKPAMQSASHGKGSVFLVDRQSHVVLWSIYARPKSTAADEMNHLAAKIADQFVKARVAKK